MPRGGKRRGAGAPRRNHNAFKHGASRRPARELLPMIEWLIREHPDIFGSDPPVLHLDRDGNPWLYLNAEGVPFDPHAGRYLVPKRDTLAALRDARIQLQARLRREYHRRLIAWYRTECAESRQP